MGEIDRLTEALIAFREARDWKQFHNPKDLAVAVSVESGELLEQFLWKQPEEVNVEKVKEEIADVLAYILLLTNHYGFDLSEILLAKIASNELKYPVDKAKGSAKKYDEL